VFSSSDDKTVRYWDLPTEKEVQVLRGHEDYVRCGSTVASSPALWISGGYDHKVLVWDMRSGKAVINIDHGHPVEAVLPFRSSTILLTAGADNEIRVWDILAGGRKLRSVSNHQKAITTLSFNSDCSRLISGSLDQHLKIYDVVDYSVVHTIKYNAPILCSALSRNNRYLVTGLSDGMLSIRHRPSKSSEHSRAQARSASIKGGSYRFFLRAKRAAPDEFYVPRRPKKSFSQSDKHLRAFKYKKALDAALTTSDVNTICALLEELAHRKALLRTLGGRNDIALAPLLTFILDHITNPRYSSLLIQVSQVVLNIYESVVGQSTMVDTLLQKLLQKVKAELDFQEQSLRLIGSLDMLINSTASVAPIPQTLT